MIISFYGGNYATELPKRNLLVREVTCGNVDFIEDLIEQLAKTLPYGVDYRSCAKVVTVLKCAMAKSRFKPPVFK